MGKRVDQPDDIPNFAPTVHDGKVRNNEKVADRLARELLDFIAQRKLRPGTKLPSEAAMVEHYGVGRASVREALRILEVYGIIHLRSGVGGGPVVNQINARAFGRTTSLYLHVLSGTSLEVFEARRVIEPTMARLAAERINPTTAHMLEAVVERAEKQDTDMHEWRDATSEFHAVLAGISGNRLLDLYGSSLVDLHLEQLIGTHYEREFVNRIHRRIAEAILTGDGETAERLTRKHIEAMHDAMKVGNPHLLREPIRWK